MNKNIILVYGGRDFDDWDCVYTKLDQVYKDYGLGGQFPQDPFGDGTRKEVIVITGGARGVDTAALEWASDRELTAIRMPARWNAEGRKGGYLRNKRMLQFALALRGNQGKMVCVGFPGGLGTADMAGRCATAYTEHGGNRGALWLEVVR